MAKKDTDSAVAEPVKETVQTNVKPLRIPTRTPQPRTEANLKHIKVRATQIGFAAAPLPNGEIVPSRRRAGDVFTLMPILNARGQVLKTAEQQFSEVWMERVADSVEDRITTGREEITERKNEIIREKMGIVRANDQSVI